MLRKAVKHIIDVGRKPVGHAGIAAKIAGKPPTKTARDTYDCHVTPKPSRALSLSLSLKKVSKPHAPYGHPQ